MLDAISLMLNDFEYTPFAWVENFSFTFEMKRTFAHHRWHTHGYVEAFNFYTFALALNARERVSENVLKGKV
jgi:hypothetical protein